MPLPAAPRQGIKRLPPAGPLTRRLPFLRHIRTLPRRNSAIAPC